MPVSVTLLLDAHTVFSGDGRSSGTPISLIIFQFVVIHIVNEGEVDFF